MEQENQGQNAGQQMDQGDLGRQDQERQGNVDQQQNQQNRQQGDTGDELRSDRNMTDSEDEQGDRSEDR